MSAQTAKTVGDSIAHAFISRSKPISRTVMRFGGGNCGALTITELETAIAIDPEFSLRVLALANSAFYSQQHEISSLRSALVVLGAETVHNLAASLLARALYATPKTEDENLWQHCHAVGVAAQMLAEVHRKVDARSAFAAGLLHDIGLLALQALDQDDPELFSCHEALGGEIAQLLGLSPSLAAAIRGHGGHETGEKTHASLQATIYIANEVAIRCDYAHDKESAGDDDCLREFIGFLELEESDTDALAAALPARLQALEASSP